jgi:hypothetical protein
LNTSFDLSSLSNLVSVFLGAGHNNIGLVDCGDHFKFELIDFDLYQETQAPSRGREPMALMRGEEIRPVLLKLLEVEMLKNRNRNFIQKPIIDPKMFDNEPAFLEESLDKTNIWRLREVLDTFDKCSDKNNVDKQVQIASWVFSHLAGITGNMGRFPEQRNEMLQFFMNHPISNVTITEDGKSSRDLLEPIISAETAEDRQKQFRSFNG